MLNSKHKIIFYSFVVFLIISASLFIAEGNLFADSSKEDRSQSRTETDKKKNDKYKFLYEIGPFEGFVAPDLPFPIFMVNRFPFLSSEER